MRIPTKITNAVLPGNFRLYIANKMKHFSCNCGYIMCVVKHLQEKKTDLSCNGNNHYYVCTAFKSFKRLRVKINCAYDSIHSLVMRFSFLMTSYVFNNNKY